MASNARHLTSASAFPQPPVFDPGSALEDPEILFDPPTGLVPPHDPFRPFRRRAPLARHQQPFQRRAPRRRVGLQYPHHPRRYRPIRWPVLRRQQFHLPDAQLGHRRPRRPRPLPALRADPHRPTRLHRRLEVRLRRQRPNHRRPQLPVPHLHPPLPARTRPHHQTGLVGMRRLPLQQVVDVALPVPDHHHPRPGARPTQRPALVEPPEPAPALLLPLRRRFGLRTRPRLQAAHPQRPTPLGERHRRMHEQAPRAARPLLKRTQPPRARLQTRVVQRRRVLHQQHRRRLPAALHQRFPVRLQNVFAAHLLIVQETIGRLLLRAARKNRRQRLPRMPLPTRPQPLQTRPQAPVGQVRTPELAPRPTRLFIHRQGRKRPRRPRRRTPQRLRPTRRQTPKPNPLRRHRIRRPGRPTRRPAHARPTRRPVARPPTRRRHARLQQQRPNPVTRLPVRRQTPRHPAQDVRGQVRHANPAQHQKTVVRHHLTDVQPPRPVVPAQVSVPRTQPQRRRHEAQHPQGTQPRLHQIRQTAARRTRPAQRMLRRQQGTAQPPLRRRVRHPQPDLPQPRQAAAKHRQRQPRLDRRNDPPRRTRLRRRQRQRQRRRQTRQGLPSRRRTQRPPRVAPPVPLAQTTAQRSPRQLAKLQLPPQPLHRLRLQNAQPNSHRFVLHRTPALCQV